MSCTSFSRLLHSFYPYPCSRRYQHRTRLVSRWGYIFWVVLRWEFDTNPHSELGLYKRFIGFGWGRWGLYNK